MDYTVHGILQARILEWVAFLFSRGSSQPRDRTQVSRITGRFFTSWATREAQVVLFVGRLYLHDTSLKKLGFFFGCSRSLSKYKVVYSMWVLLVVACRIFSCGTQMLSWVMWDLISWPGIKPRPPALRAWSLSHWTTEEIPAWCFIVGKQFHLGDLIWAKPESSFELHKVRITLSLGWVR